MHHDRAWSYMGHPSRGRRRRRGREKNHVVNLKREFKYLVGRVITYPPQTASVPNYNALGGVWAAGRFIGITGATTRNAELGILAVFLRGEGLERWEWGFLNPEFQRNGN